ncbi:MAG: sugar ABC transporter substrate-binding protein, partial [Actinomycetota bacterium]|nr:sugar ABC transporter substrate-binding protein [Actinomycetota bacterium]
MIRKVAVTLLVVMVLAACSSSSGSEVDVIQVQVSGEAEEITVYESLVNAFEKQSPDIDVQLVPVADKDDHLAKLTTSFSTGNPPDVYLINFREYSQYVARGAVDAVGRYLDEAGVDLDDYYDPPLEAFTYDGELQCMPQNISSLVVYYNTKLLKSAGLERPPSDWDWDEFRRYAVELTGGGARGLGIEPNVIRLAPFVWSNGGELNDDPGKPSRFTLEQPASREALEYIVSLVRDEGVVPTEDEIAAQDLETRFVAGKLGMLLSSRREVPAFREVAGLRFDVAPLPISEERAGILHSDAYCMAAGAPASDEAFEFVRFATGKQGQTITALGGRTVPSMIEVAESGAFLDPTRAPRHSQVFLDGIDSIRRTPVIPTWPEIEDEAEEILTRMFYEDGYSIDDGLRELDEAT